MSNFYKRCVEFENFTADNVKIKAQQLLKSQELQDYCLCKSFNEKSNISSQTKAVIVGTLTPQRGRNNGYFYSSPTNNLLKYIDNYFDAENSPLTKLKDKLNSNPADENILKEINKTLDSLHVAFLDVVGTAVASKSNASDNEILCFNLDYDAFKNIDTNNVTFICNSHASEFALKQIAKHNNQKITIDYAPQIWRCKTLEQIQARWTSALDKVFK